MSQGRRRSSRPRRTAWPWAVASVAFVLTACSPGERLPATPTPLVLGLPAGSFGVCAAMAALPDRAAAERAFVNLAHGALHGLSVDPRLDRSKAARVLEAMQRVEADFSQSADVTVLGDDLTGLHAAADAALLALGFDVPSCAS